MLSAIIITFPSRLRCLPPPQNKGKTNQKDYHLAIKADMPKWRQISRRGSISLWVIVATFFINNIFVILFFGKWSHIQKLFVIPRQCRRTGGASWQRFMKSCKMFWFFWIKLFPQYFLNKDECFFPRILLEFLPDDEWRVVGEEKDRLLFQGLLSHE